MSDLIEAPSGLPAKPDADTTLLDIIARAAADPNTDVEKLERLTALYERHMEREAHAAYTAALAEMQPELPEIEEHGEIHDKQGQVQSTYALWEDVQRQIKPILAKYGFALTFAIGQDEARLTVTGKLSHRLGHVEQTTMALPLDASGSKNLVQQHGSSTSYGMRYTARALLNLTSRGADDDGVAGGATFISQGQLEALDLLLAKTGRDHVAFCQHLKISSLDQLPARRYREAEKTLQETIAKREAQRRPKT